MIKVIENLGKDQHVIENDGEFIFQSYQSVICLIDASGAIHLSSDWEYSRTTMKYLGQFLVKYANFTEGTAKHIRSLIDAEVVGVNITSDGDWV